MRVLLELAFTGYTILLFVLPAVLAAAAGSPHAFPGRRVKAIWKTFVPIIVYGIFFLCLYWLAHRLLLGHGNLFLTLSKFCTLQLNCQDVQHSSIALFISALCGAALGLALQTIVRNTRKGVPAGRRSPRRKAFIFLCLSLSFMISAMFYELGALGTRKLRINEISINQQTSEDGPIFDYVELYNPGLFNCASEGLFLTDNKTDLRRQPLPASDIPAGGYMVVFLDKTTGFSLKKEGGETLILSDLQGNILDQADTVRTAPATAYARQEDGSDTWKLLSPTPYISNSFGESREPALRFSHESGFYEEAFDLTITSKDGESIFYTLDGTTPTVDAIPYRSPIHISDASQNPNLYSTNTDVSSGFLTELIREAGQTAPGYKTPSTPIDKCTVVRAISVSEEGETISSITASYFVGFSQKPGYQGMNFLSIVTDPGNLFSDDAGIYVMGNDYHPLSNENWLWWGGNYHRRGPEWEREAFLQFFDADGSLILSKEAGIRIQGRGTRGSLPKNLNLYARTEYDGDNRFSTYFFDTEYQPQRLTLFSGGDDALTKLQDLLIASLVSGQHFATLHFEPYVMFLDGEYWGMYWLTEKYDNEYLEYHYGVDKQNIVMMKNNELVSGEEGEDNLYWEMSSFISYTDLTVEANYEAACELIDMDSFIEYFATEIYINRYGDWPGSNWAAWRTREVREDPCSDGRWRWMLFDVNSNVIGPGEAETDSIAYTRSISTMFDNLMRNDSFREQFRKTLLRLAEHEFSPEKTRIFIREYQASMADVLSLEYRRFYGDEQDKLQEFYTLTDGVQEFFEIRQDYIKKLLQQLT